MKNDLIEVPGAPAIPGLCFRHFRGESDYPKMVAAIAASAEADRIERADTLEDITISYAHLTNSDPYQDMIFAEIDGLVIGYSRILWWDEIGVGIIYTFVGFLTPAWRRKGIGQTILTWVEERIRSIAASHLLDQPRYIQAWAHQFQSGTAILLEQAGYKAIRYFHEMVRPTLDDIPDIPLPDGLAVRMVLPEHYRELWEVTDETYRDHWGYYQQSEEDYQAWLGNKATFQPELWQIAWDEASNQIVGHVLTYINHTENEKYKRKRGYTENIGVRRAWRKQGLARALIVRSLLVQKAQGMTESALQVDSENLTGATRLYEQCGFRTVKLSTVYRKPI